MPRVVSAFTRYDQLMEQRRCLVEATARVARDQREWMQATCGAGLAGWRLPPAECHDVLMESRRHYGHVEARVAQAERLWMAAKARERQQKTPKSRETS
jgi:hypothetical protein